MFAKNIVHKAVIHYVHFQRSLRKVSKLYGASPSTLCRWVRKEFNSIPRPRKTPRSTSLVQDAVYNILQNDPFHTLNTIMDALKLQGIVSSKSTIHRHIKQSRYSRKRAAHRFSPKVPLPEDARDFLTTVQKFKEVVSIDETSIVLEKRPLYGYSLKGTRPVHRSNKPHRGNRITLLLAVSNTRGVIAHKTFSGSCNRDIFASFIRNDVSAPGAVVTLDNVRFHHSNNVKLAADASKLTLLFTPPYSPDFNFIENAFSIIKSHTRRFDACDHIEEAIGKVTKKTAMSLYQHMLRFVEKVARQ